MSDLLASLDENQRRVALALVGPVRVLAGAGSGKTRAITHRIAYGVETGVYTADKVLALSFTTKAAGEMKSRLAGLGVSGVACRTFHSAALRQLGHFWPDLVGGESPRIRSTKSGLLTQAAEQLSLPTSTEVLRAVAAEIEWRKVRLLSMDDYASALANRPLPTGITAPRLIDLIGRYESLKDERRELDFEDVLIATLGMLSSEPWVAARVREQFRFLVVDEYQDISPVQRALLDAWRGDRSDVCVVGDPGQTIYSFTGASDEFLRRFDDEFPGTTSIELDRNYRSTPEIVAFAQGLIPDSPIHLVAVRPHGEAPRVRRFSSDDDEAATVAHSIRDAIAAGTRPSDIAILYRINSQSLTIESALSAAGVPFRVRGARFFDEQLVKQAMVLLRGFAETNPDTSAGDAMALLLREHFGWISKPPTNPTERWSWNVLSALNSLAENAPAGATSRDLYRELARRAEDDIEPVVDAVTLSTVHAAKGLEWDTVFLIGMSEGLFPLAHATSESALAEERRLAYVAVTRAESALTLSWAERGTRGGGTRSPSRFIASTPEGTHTRTEGASGEAS